MTDPIKIRAHHLLCMQGFQGYGYSDAFTEHLGKIVTQFREKPDTRIALTAACDEICSGCPHQVHGRCQMDAESDSRIRAMDTAILTKMQTEPGSCGTIAKMFQQAGQTFPTKASVTDICGDCQWDGICSVQPSRWSRRAGNASASGD